MESAKPSIKRCNYITKYHRRLGSVPVGVGVSWGTRCQRENQLADWGLADWGLAALSDPRLRSPARMRKKCCYGQKNLGLIYSSLSPSPTHLSHTRNITLSRIKCERYIFFIKKCVRSFIEVRILLLTIFQFIVVLCICMWLYNKIIILQFR